MSPFHSDPEPALPGFRLNARRGFLLYFVVSILIMAGILAVSLGTYKQGAVEQLARTVDQNRLLTLAQAAGQEILALVRHQANQPSAPISQAFRAVFADPDPLAKGFWMRTVDLPAGALPHASALAQDVRGAGYQVEGRLKIVVTGRSNTLPVSCEGYLEVLSRACRSDAPNDGMEVKERRELKLVNLQDFLDKYALYVKSYVPDYNDPERRLTVNGVPSRSAYSWIYVGNRFYPPCLEFPGGEAGVASGQTPPPVLFDIDFLEDRALLAGFTQGEAGFTLSFPATGAPSGPNPSDRQMFWVVPQPVPFQPFYNQGFYRFADFLPVPQLQEFYRKRIAEPAVNDPAANDLHTVPYEIARDYLANKNNVAQTDAYQAVVRTCIENWSYLFGYTDFSHLCRKVGDLTSFAKTPPFTGLLTWFTAFDGYNEARLLGGKMPLFFGGERKTAVMMEGQAFVRFFKIALFDFFRASFELHGKQVPVDIEPIPLDFERGLGTGTFLSRPIPKLSGNERCLMSRAVDEFPLNRFFFPKETKVRPEPEQYGSQVPGRDILPAFDPKIVSHLFPDGARFLAERLVTDADQQPVLDLDGLMVISRGGLDLTKVHRYRGRGHILVLDGDCRLADLRRRSAGHNDSLKLYLSRGSFEVISPSGSPVSIAASLVALSALATPNSQGHFYANGCDVTIEGNLVVDFLPVGTKGARGMGRKLTITHDPRLFQPGDPWRVSLGQVRSLYSVQAGKRSW